MLLKCCTVWTISLMPSNLLSGSWLSIAVQTLKYRLVHYQICFFTQNRQMSYLFLSIFSMSLTNVFTTYIATTTFLGTFYINFIMTFTINLYFNYFQIFYIVSRLGYGLLTCLPLLLRLGIMYCFYYILM